MFDLDRWLEVFSTLRRNKLRTLLTASGVFWGIFMLVLMLGFGSGLELGVKKNMLGFMANRVWIWGGRTRMAFEGFQPGRRIHYCDEDTALIRREVVGVEALAPRMELGGWREGNTVNYFENAGNFRVFGDVAEYARVDKMSPYVGRFINEQDVREKRKVAVIGDQVRQILFPTGTNPVGKFIAVRGVYFLVVGVFRSDRPGDAGERENGSLHVPLSTLQTTFNMPNAVGFFGVLVDADQEASDVEARMRRVLGRKYRVHPRDESAIGSYNEGERYQRFERLFGGIRFFIWLVSVATMCAGALGVSNIMLISVKERTREIGVRKALGATPSAIVGLIMQEATLLTALSGYAGLVVGVAALELSSKVLEGAKGPVASPSIDLVAALVATALLVLTGVIAGIGPARHAARIQPVEALRTE